MSRARARASRRAGGRPGRCSERPRRGRHSDRFHPAWVLKRATKGRRASLGTGRCDHRSVGHPVRRDRPGCLVRRGSSGHDCPVRGVRRRDGRRPDRLHVRRRSLREEHCRRVRACSGRSCRCGARQGGDGSLSPGSRRRTAPAHPRRLDRLVRRGLGRLAAAGGDVDRHHLHPLHYSDRLQASTRRRRLRPPLPPRPPPNPRVRPTTRRAAPPGRGASHRHAAARLRPPQA